MSETQTEHPMPVQAFIKTLKGTPDEVYSRLLLINHRSQNKTPTAWRAQLETHRSLPAASAPEIRTYGPRVSHTRSKGRA